MTLRPTDVLSEQTAAHLEAWLEHWTRDDGERDDVRAKIIRLVASDVSLLDTHTWTEMRRLAEVAQ